jgi:hypothetical protein
VRPDRGVADEHVDRSELGGCLLHHALDRGRIRDIAEDGDSAHTDLLALGGHRIELVLVDARVERQIRALGGECQCDGTSDIAAGTGDQCGLALEPHAACLLLAPAISSSAGRVEL